MGIDAIRYTASRSWVHGVARVLLASDAKKKVEEYVSNGLHADWPGAPRAR
jgi:hypothetical protein